MLIIDHGGRYYTVYGHLSKLAKGGRRPGGARRADRLGRGRHRVRPTAALLRGPKERQAGGPGPLVPEVGRAQTVTPVCGCKGQDTRIGSSQGEHTMKLCNRKRRVVGAFFRPRLGPVPCRAAGAAGFRRGSRRVSKPGDLCQYPCHRSAELRQGSGNGEARVTGPSRACWLLWIPIAAI